MYSDFKVPDRSPNFLAMHCPALPASVVRLTGAGDCLVGGMLASLSIGLDMMQSVAIGIAATKALVEVDSNTQLDLSSLLVASFCFFELTTPKPSVALTPLISLVPIFLDS
ncbi:putative sugar kinase YeiI isoform X2 [Gossypium australe]|uniref:Putative sugar kinase YeiI isoform X2 n=1 Tax=Gossypium australe TaxID=47621 RepID=A0A5B6V1P8_9ROSI|nr:putative sugar kinase YeiI isoform X2 [Gossypium australe]